MSFSPLKELIFSPASKIEQRVSSLEDTSGRENLLSFYKSLLFFIAI